MSQAFQRSSPLLSGLQAAANLATLVAAGLLSFVLVRNYLISAPPARSLVSQSSVASVSVGRNLRAEFPEVNWGNNRETVLLALSTHCHFCTDSAPFFRQLSGKSGKTFKIVAILPESAVEAQDYLKREGVHVDQLRQMSLDKVGVSGTPTMLLVNSRGTVTKSWVGMLNTEAQGEALKVIDSGRPEKGHTEL